MVIPLRNLKSGCGAGRKERWESGALLISIKVNASSAPPLRCPLFDCDFIRSTQHIAGVVRPAFQSSSFAEVARSTACHGINNRLYFWMTRKYEDASPGSSFKVFEIPSSITRFTFPHSLDQKRTNTQPQQPPHYPKKNLVNDSADYTSKAGRFFLKVSHSADRRKYRQPNAA